MGHGCVGYPQCQSQPCGENDSPVPISGGTGGTLCAGSHQRAGACLRPVLWRGGNAASCPDARSPGARCRKGTGVCSSQQGKNFPIVQWNPKTSALGTASVWAV